MGLQRPGQGTGFKIIFVDKIDVIHHGRSAPLLHGIKIPLTEWGCRAAKSGSKEADERNLFALASSSSLPACLESASKESVRSVCRFAEPPSLPLQPC